MNEPNGSVSIQVYGETGETIIIDDGMGGSEEVPEEDWYDVVKRVPARYRPEGVSLQREERGDRVSESPAVGVKPRFLGSLVDGEFAYEDAELAQPGIDKRVDINAHAAPEGRTKVTKVTPEFGMGHMPAMIWFELEAVTE